jgi:hypothetical protein
MKYQELLTAQIAQIKFEPNYPIRFTICMEFGEIEYVHLTPLIKERSKTAHFMIHHEGGEWLAYNEKIDFGKLGTIASSSGCATYQGWLISKNLESFSQDVELMAETAAMRYIKKTAAEIAKLQASIDLITDKFEAKNNG